jgi:hypothetical protein
MANSLSNKLDKLENNVVPQKIDESKIHLDFSEFPEAEQELHRYVLNRLKYVDPKNLTILSPQDKELLEKSAMLLSQRAIMLFRNTLQLLAMIKEKSGYEMEFNIRFGWFMHECLQLGQQSLDMEKLERENAGLNEDALEDKRIELENKQPKLFTKESYNLYENELLRKTFEHHQIKLEAEPHV